MTAAAQVAMVVELEAAVAAAAPETVMVALLRGLVAAHGPYWQERQCVSKFYVDGVPGCSSCAEYGAPVEVRSRPAVPGAVWHVRGVGIGGRVGCSRRCDRRCWRVEHPGLHTPT